MLSCFYRQNDGGTDTGFVNTAASNKAAKSDDPGRNEKVYAFRLYKSHGK